MKKIFPLIIFPFLLFSCQSKDSEQDTITDIIPVKIQKLQQDTVHQQYLTSGYFTTNNETPLSFKSGGIIQKIYVKEGDPIRKGQLLATVFAAEIQSAVGQTNLAVSKAERDFERAKNLYHDSVATLEQMQNAQTALNIARQQQKAANFNNHHTEIRALENGFVLKQFMQEGQMAGPGMPVLLVNGTNQGNWIFKTSVSDVQWANLKVGDRATITTDAAPNNQMEAVVDRKSEGVDPNSGAFTIQLKIKDAMGTPLAAGLFGKVTLYPSSSSQGVLIPYEALLDGSQDSGFVFITKDKKTVQKVGVRIQSISTKGVLIQSGLPFEAFLITTGSPYLKDGSKIKVSEE